MKLYTIKEISEMFRVSEQSVRRWIKQGKLKAVRIGNIRISEEELNSFIKPAVESEKKQ